MQSLNIVWWYIKVILTYSKVSEKWKGRTMLPLEERWHAVQTFHQNSL